VLVEDRALDALDEAVGEGVARLDSRVMDFEGAAGLVERALELASAIVEDSLGRPTRARQVGL